MLRPSNDRDELSPMPDTLDVEVRDVVAPPSEGTASAQQRDSGGSVLLSVCMYIIVCEFCERLAYYGMAGSLVLLLQDELSYTNADADNQYSLWSGFCYVTPLLGGWIADSYLGRYRSILIFSSIYVVGLALLVVGVLPGDIQAPLIFLSIYIIALGTGGIKPNVSTYGAEQFDASRPQDRKELESFFNWFYWSINLGALISYTVVANICQFGIKSLGGKDWRFAVGFTIPLITMILAILLFVAGTPRYKSRPAQGSVLSTALRIMGQAVFNRHRAPASSTSAPPHWLDRAKARYGGNYRDADVEGVKAVWRLTPYLLLTVPYWAVYTQMSTAFQNQGCQMDLRLGSSVTIAVSTLNLFDTLAILLLIPVFDRVIYPFFKRRGKPLSMLTRIGWGFFTAALAMVAAGLVEVYRKSKAPAEMTYMEYASSGTLSFAESHVSACKSLDDYSPYTFQQWWAKQQQATGKGRDYAPAYCRQTCTAVGADGLLALDCIVCDVVPLVSPISVMWQIPQFILVGMSEILASVTGLEFFFSQAPDNMKSFTQALNLFTTALGAWACIPLVYMANLNRNHQWVPADLNQGYLSSYFWLLAAIMVVDLGLFAYIAQGYEYKEAVTVDCIPLPSSVQDVGSEGDDEQNSDHSPGDRAGYEPEVPLLSPASSSMSPSRQVKSQARAEHHE